MARAALEWSLADLSAASGISRRTILRFERGETVMPATVKALRHALEAKSILFIDSGHLAGGVIPPKGGN
jgi:transcriptional regulator with XRE-family HTH domain